MKKILLVVTLLVLGLSSLMAAGSKIGYIDSEQIMKQSKDAQSAQQTYATEYQTWKSQAEKMDEEIKRLTDELEQRSLTLSKEGKKEAEKKIEDKKNELKKYLKDHFSETGVAARRNVELLEPILTKVQEKIKKVALDEDLDIVLDAANSGILYAKPGLDITQKVIDEMNANQ